MNATPVRPETAAAEARRIPENVRRANAWRFHLEQAADLCIAPRHVEQWATARFLEGRV